MSSRDDILASIRANLPRVDRPLPHIPLFDDNPPASLLSAFKDSLHRMGGVFLDPPISGDILAPVRAKTAGAKIVCSMAPEIAGNRDIADLGALRDLADVDFAIVRTSFAVAETGSVLLPVRQTDEIDIAFKIVGLRVEVLHHALDLPVKIFHRMRQKAFQPVLAALF